VKLVLLDDDGRPVAEIPDLDQYDLSTTRDRAMLVDDILVAMGNADRRRVLDFMRGRGEDGTLTASLISGDSRASTDR
jgi:hypothetical protein